MSLDVSLIANRPKEVFEWNITHNLNEMASHADLYDPCWHPENLGIETAGELIPFLESGLMKLKSAETFFKSFNPSNGWGDYDGLVIFVEAYLKACKENPDAKIRISV
ncbi:MAG: hypothetical protein WA061_01905 [Microgenomates group bacterium]